MSTEALERAIQVAGGTQDALARKMRKHLKRKKFSQQNISYWITHDVKVAAEYWEAIERATDNQVTRQDLRPDIFGTPVQRHTSAT